MYARTHTHTNTYAHTHTQRNRTTFVALVASCTPCKVDVLAAEKTENQNTDITKHIQGVSQPSTSLNPSPPTPSPNTPEHRPCGDVWSEGSKAHLDCGAFFYSLPLPCIILNANRRTKNRGGLGTRLYNTRV